VSELRVELPFGGLGEAKTIFFSFRLSKKVRQVLPLRSYSFVSFQENVGSAKNNFLANFTKSTNLRKSKNKPF